MNFETNKAHHQYNAAVFLTRKLLFGQDESGTLLDTDLPDLDANGGQSLLAAQGSAKAVGSTSTPPPNASSMMSFKQRAYIWNIFSGKCSFTFLYPLEFKWY